MKKLDHSDIIVTIDHPHGIIEATLYEWTKMGPGHMSLFKPIEAKNKKTGDKLSLKIIPFKYRNSPLSRFLVKWGIVTDPWK
ncbi:MAG: hypothetical protein GY714_33260 [Desulfobacterales bacterium]|nr:hypothetical protein [Desulfobacterales bacterium]